MRRALTLALLLAAADAGLRIGKPSGAGALKMATREEEKKAKEERRAKRKAAMSKDPEQARKELKAEQERLCPDEASLTYANLLSMPHKRF